MTEKCSVKCSDKCSDKCDIFDFMADHVGLTVLHPGGFRATEELAGRLNIDKDSRVIDIACGKGTTSVLLARKFGCRVIGVDISPELIGYAKRYARKKGVADRVEFRVADALALPFEKDTFDAAISQAMLILVDNKKKAVQEAMRVIKPGGRAGWLELSWKKKPDDRMLEALKRDICAYCMLNVETFDGWKRIFRGGGAKNLDIEEFPLGVGGMRDMVRDEGFVNTLRIMGKYVLDSGMRKRMGRINNVFKTKRDHFWYGIYVATK